MTKKYILDCILDSSEIVQEFKEISKLVVGTTKKKQLVYEINMLNFQCFGFYTYVTTIMNF